MAAVADIAIAPVTGPEVLTGSTRLKAGTATKFVLNMLSTGVMIRTGAVYGNLMVNVQTTNAKLIDRAQRIIAAATGVDQPTAARLLSEAGTVKTAIVMQKLSLDRAAAEAKLKAAKGKLSGPATNHLKLTLKPRHSNPTSSRPKRSAVERSLYFAFALSTTHTLSAQRLPQARSHQRNLHRLSWPSHAFSRHSALLLATTALTAQQAPTMPTNPYLALMTAARAHAKAHGAPTPVLSPVDATVCSATILQSTSPQLHHAGFRVVPWTTNDPAKMRALIDLRVDGIITDRPDILQTVLQRRGRAHPADAAYFATLRRRRPSRRPRPPPRKHPALLRGRPRPPRHHARDRHRRHHRPRLPHLARSVPQPAVLPPRRRHPLHPRKPHLHPRHLPRRGPAHLHLRQAPHRPQFPDVQTNDLSLSPVAVAFAKQEHLISPYVPTHVEQLFRFVAFYARLLHAPAPANRTPTPPPAPPTPPKSASTSRPRSCPLPNDPAGNSVASLPLPKPGAEPTTNHTVDPQTFVTTLCGIITRNHMESRAEVQSFDFRTLQLVEEQFPKDPHLLPHRQPQIPEHRTPPPIPPPTLTHRNRQHAMLSQARLSAIADE